MTVVNISSTNKERNISCLIIKEIWAFKDSTFCFGIQFNLNK